MIKIFMTLIRRRCARRDSNPLLLELDQNKYFVTFQLLDPPFNEFINVVIPDIGDWKLFTTEKYNFKN